MPDLKILIYGGLFSLLFRRQAADLQGDHRGAEAGRDRPAAYGCLTYSTQIPSRTHQPARLWRPYSSWRCSICGGKGRARNLATALAIAAMIYGVGLFVDPQTEGAIRNARAATEQLIRMARATSTVYLGAMLFLGRGSRQLPCGWARDTSGPVPLEPNGGRCAKTERDFLL